MSLTKRSATGAMWNAAGNLTRIALQFGVGVLLARLIGPSEFGRVAVAVLMIAFCQLFVDFGFNAAIVQTRNLLESDINALGTLQIIIAAAMSAIAFVCAPVVAVFFHDPDVVPIIRWMGMMFLLRGIGQNAVALLNRELRFRAVQIGMMAGYVVGYVAVAVPMAFAGFGAWSLVAGQLVQAALTSAIAIYQIGRFHSMTLRGLRGEMLAFGRMVISANLGSWALSSLDSVIVGHVIGPTSLAYYNRSATLANAMTQALLSGLQGVLFAASARAADNPEGCRRAFYTCVEIMVLITAPILLSLAAGAHTVVLVLYGSKWEASASLLPPLCIAAVINGVVGFFGPVIMGTGKIERETRAQWIAVAIMFPCIYLIAQFGKSAVLIAWSLVAFYSIRLVLLWRALGSVLPLDRSKMLRAIFPGLFVAVLAGLSTALADKMSIGLVLNLRLLMDISAGGAGTLVGIIFVHHLILRGEVGQVLLNLPRLSPSTRNWLQQVARIKIED